MAQQCFDSNKYLKIQQQKIKERICMFDKLYLEFGGKLVDDQHAARTLPGFLPDLKIRLLQEFKDDAEVILCINANAIEHSKIRADHMISYEVEVLRLIEFLRSRHIYVSSVVITLYDGQKKAKDFAEKLKDYDVKVYFHQFTKGYPTDVDTIVSDEGYGANPYIETSRKLVVVSAPGPGSGKLATALSQLYHEYKRGVNAGYAKFETFPVWSLPLKHPVNIAYEAATADLVDKNLVDHFHLDKYGISAVNYNRDLETFPVLREILRRITGRDIYYSPTDMGVNVIGECINDDAGIQQAAKDEIIRRYYRALVDVKKGTYPPEAPERIKLLMNELGISERDRSVVAAAEKKRAASGRPAAAIELDVAESGHPAKSSAMKKSKSAPAARPTFTGRRTDYLSPVSSAFLNALKSTARIPDDVYLIAPAVLEPILAIKDKTSNFKETSLHLGEVLLALSICGTTNPIVAQLLARLDQLAGAELHATHMIPDDELVILANLGLSATSGTEVDYS